MLEHSNKTNIVIKLDKGMFWFPSTYSHNALQSIKYAMSLLKKALINGTLKSHYWENPIYFMQGYHKPQYK